MWAFGVVAAYQGRVTGAAAPPIFLPPSFLEGSSLRPTKTNPRCRIKGSNTCSRRDFLDGSRYGCVGVLVFECVAE